jgi:murein L,D-transpeptidase YcbB/YkuD
MWRGSRTAFFAGALLLSPAVLANDTPNPLPLPGTMFLPETLAPVLRDALEHGSTSSGATRLMDLDALRRFYVSRDFQPAWIGVSHEQETRLVLDALVHADAEGLNPADYHLNDLRRLAAARTSSASADYELVLTDNFFHYARNVRSGRMPPNAIDGDIGLPANGFDPVAGLSQALSSKGLADFLAALPPPHVQYQALRQALAHYRAIEAQGGWPTIMDDGEIKLESADPRKARLRERLALEDPSLLPAHDDPKNVSLKEAVRRYQERNALEVDGRAGRQTIQALNVTVTARIAQIIANMERWRWMPRTLGTRYIAVNAADATLQVVADGKTVLSSRAIVGKPKSPSAIFAATVTGVTVNPYWNVPNPIARNEMLPKLRRNPNYLASQHIEILNGPDGDPYGTGINWRAVSRENFHYTLRQLPGADNALGFVKLEMPNLFNAYLHDTPSRNLFARSERHLSHGCLRVEQIQPLASFALTGDVAAGLEKLQAAIALGTTQQFSLDNKLPIFVLYWTAIANQDGTADFRADVYGRDARLLAALAGHPASGLSMNTTECSVPAG